MALLEAESLIVDIETKRGRLRAVDRLSLTLEEGETLGIVGESGCGKSLTSLALMGLLPPAARATADRLRFLEHDLLTVGESTRRRLRGREMAMIFQDPMSSLNPSFTVGFQLDEVLRPLADESKKSRREKALQLLGRVGIKDAATKLSSYPHELSGGLSQRVMIAMAIAARPRLLIADEPTTALDVTIQAQILALLRDLQKEDGMALLLITHDLGVVEAVTDRVVVMYAGQQVETGRTESLLHAPRHPYTNGLIRCLPGCQGEAKAPLASIPGIVPDLLNRPSGCRFHPRCERVTDRCRQAEPSLAALRCHHPLDGNPPQEISA